MFPAGTCTTILRPSTLSSEHEINKYMYVVFRKRIHKAYFTYLRIWRRNISAQTSAMDCASDD
jgi:hypothetical protein